VDAKHRPGEQEYEGAGNCVEWPVTKDSVQPPSREPDIQTEQEDIEVPRHLECADAREGAHSSQ
jgi:hypothetical protein